MSPEPMRSSVGSRRQRGSVLMIMPAAMLIIIVLGAIALDRAIVFGEQRELVQAAQAAANDAASTGIDVAATRTGSDLVYDGRRIDDAVMLTVAHLDEPGTTATWEIQGDLIVVHMERRVDLVFSGAVPAGPSSQVIRATARAELRPS